MALDFSVLENDDTISPRDVTLRHYAVDRNGSIRNPGKFEGAPIFAPFLHYLSLDGLSDATEPHPEDADVVVEIFDVDDDMRRWFPELNGCRRVHLWWDSLGFVHAVKEI